MSTPDEIPEVAEEAIEEEVVEEPDKLRDSEDAFDLVTEILRRAAGTDDVGLVTGYYLIVETHDPETQGWGIDRIIPGSTPPWRDEALLREAIRRFTRRQDPFIIMRDEDDDEFDDDEFDDIDDEEDYNG